MSRVDLERHTAGFAFAGIGEVMCPTRCTERANSIWLLEGAV